MQQLQCGAQSYAWGKKAPESEVARLLGESDKPENSEKRFAELWIGVHNSLPSKVVTTNTNSGVLLKDYLAERTSTYLGQSHLDFYKSPTVPFLLKVLSIDMALSIQAHPTRELAKVLHARDPKNYPDPNHKPELIVALTPFEALCCFRPLKEILFFVKQSQPLTRVLGKGAIEALERAAAAEVSGQPTTAEAKAALKLALQSVYGLAKEPLESAIAAQLELIASMGPDSTVGTSSAISSEEARKLNAVHAVFVRTNKLFPGDVGLWMMYFLNYLQLKPGDALFLGAMEPHAYISGDGVEIMANSDNVVRAGLTPKFKDVDTLLSMLTYDTNALAKSRYTIEEGAAVQQYAPPSWCDDFSLFAVRLNRSKGTTTASFDLPSVGLGVCVKGKASVTVGENETKKEEGSSLSTVQYGTDAVFPVGRVTCSLADGEEECTIFIGTTNVHGANAASKL